MNGTDLIMADPNNMDNIQWKSIHGDFYFQNRCINGLFPERMYT